MRSLKTKVSFLIVYIKNAVSKTINIFKNPPNDVGIKKTPIMDKKVIKLKKLWKLLEKDLFFRKIKNMRQPVDISQNLDVIKKYAFV